MNSNSATTAVPQSNELICRVPKKKAKPCEMVGCSYVESMKQRQVGNSGLWVSEIAYGNYLTSNFSGEELIRTALDSGITTFDTADSYTDSNAETVLGKSLRGVPRSSYEIMTKVFSPVGHSLNERGLSRKHVFHAVESSLRRLQTDYIDVYQAHHFDNITPIEEVASTFSQLIDQGKVRYIGVSNWSSQQLNSVLRVQNQKSFHKFISNQIELSLLTGISKYRNNFARRNGICHMAWSPLGEGVLTGKYSPSNRSIENSRSSDPTAYNLRLKEYLASDVLEVVKRFADFAATIGCTPAQLAISWLLETPNISSVVIGASRPGQIIENVKASDLKLDPHTYNEINRIFKPIRNSQTPRSLARSAYHRLPIKK